MAPAIAPAGTSIDGSPQVLSLSVERATSTLLSVFVPDFSGNGIVDGDDDLSVWKTAFGVSDLAATYWKSVKNAG